MADLGAYNVRQHGGPLRWDNLVRVRLSGPDAFDWIQGQITNDLRKLSADEPLKACLTKPTGQLLETLTVYQTDQGYEVVSGGQVIVERFAEFVIMEVIELEELPAPRYLTLGPGLGLAWPIGKVPAHWALEPDENSLSKEQLSVVSLEQRVAIPAWDANAKTLPPELGAAFEQSHIAYDKGCYVGQEVLQRIHSRGHVNREWKVFSSEGSLQRGAVILAHGREVGNVTRSAKSPDHGWLVGATLRSEAEGELSANETVLKEFVL